MRPSPSIQVHGTLLQLTTLLGAGSSAGELETAALLGAVLSQLQPKLWLLGPNCSCAALRLQAGALVRAALALPCPEGACGARTQLAAHTAAQCRAALARDWTAAEQPAAANWVAMSGADEGLAHLQLGSGPADGRQARALPHQAADPMAEQADSQAAALLCGPHLQQADGWHLDVEIVTGLLLPSRGSPEVRAACLKALMSRGGQGEC